MTIKEINKITERYSCEFRQHLKSMYNIGYSEGARAHRAMMELEKEEKAEWIPCSERLPEDGDTCCHVTAWMPLPEEYKKEGNV